MAGKYEYPKYAGMVSGTYKLTGDFETEAYSGKFVRDINFTPDDGRLPDLAICRVYSTREDAETILRALATAAAAAVLGRKGGSVTSERKTAAVRANGLKGGRPKGATELTPLQREALELRQSGLKIREIAARMGRQPENIRQLLGRAEYKTRKG